MPTIVFMSPKGGVGKTTAALVLANQLSNRTDVTVLDADPNRPIASWASAGAAPLRLKVVSDVDEDNILEKIDAASRDTAFVIVDLEGTAAKIVLLAASQADLIVIPTQGSQLDAEQAGRAIKAVRDTHRMTGRETPYAVLLTRTNPQIRARTLTHVTKVLAAANVPVFDTELNEREAFRALFSFRQPLVALNRAVVSNLDKAIDNAEAFAIEVISILRTNANKSSASPQAA